MKFSTFNTRVSVLLKEFPATITDPQKISQNILDRLEEIPAETTHSTFTPLQRLADKNLRKTVVDAIIQHAFSEHDGKHSSAIHDKVSFRKVLQDAMLEVKKKMPEFKVNKASADALSYRLWTLFKSDMTISPEGNPVSSSNKADMKQKLDNAIKDVAATATKTSTPQAVDTPTTAVASDGKSKDITDVLDQEFSFTEEVYDKVVEEVNALNKRAGKRNIPLISVEKTGEEVVEKRYNPANATSRKGVMLKKIKFRIKVPQLQLPGGWKFIGRVDHTDVGNLIVSVPDSGHEEDLHALYGNSQPSYCDHCNTTRKRTSTFVVQDEKNKLKRIGRQCLKDYLPGGEQGVKKMLDFAEYLSKIAEGLREWGESGGEGGYDEEGGGGGGGSSKYDSFRIKETLGVALAYVRKLGYVSKSKASAENESGGYSEPTSSKIVKGITGELENIIARAGGLAKAGSGAQTELIALDTYRENKEKYEAEAEKVIEWGKEYIAKQLERPSNMSEYFRNLQTILDGAASSGAIPERYIGYLVSIIPAYNKAIDAQDQEKLSKERGEQVSNYVGTVGAPIGDLNYGDKRKLKQKGVQDLDKFPYNGPIAVTVTGSREFERQGFGYYDTGGTTTMINMIDDDGNVFVYFANGSNDIEKGSKIIIKRALVKNHKDYTNKHTGKTVKQTLLTRATLDFVPANESFKNYFYNLQ